MNIWNTKRRMIETTKMHINNTYNSNKRNGMLIMLFLTLANFSAHAKSFMTRFTYVTLAKISAYVSNIRDPYQFLDPSQNFIDPPQPHQPRQNFTLATQATPTPPTLFSRVIAILLNRCSLKFCKIQRIILVPEPSKTSLAFCKIFNNNSERLLLNF